jgi:hypothetical protein
MALQINWVAVFVVALLGMLVPMIWYAPKLFGNTWMELSKLTPEDTKGAGPTIALAALCSLISSFALAGFLNYFGSQTFAQGCLAGAQLWLGFVATAFVTDYRFARKPWKLLFINLGHSFISLTLMGGILVVWK